VTAIPSSWPTVSETMDVSSSQDGVCMVTCHAVSITNSHAGTHADTPFHFMQDPPFESFLDEQYSGNVIVLNLHSFLKDSKAITPEMLQAAAHECCIELAQIRRLILRTYIKPPAAWEDCFAYLTPAAATYLASLPLLVMVGTDAPSIDHPHAAPIHIHAHGELYKQRIAILEGLDCSTLPDALCTQGVLQTIWMPMQQFKDARGCVCLFYPQRQ